jgi:hypothetical protein
MSYHHCRIHLPVNAMAELVATDGGCGGHICKISGIRPKVTGKTYLGHRPPRDLGSFETLKTAIRSVGPGAEKHDGTAIT